jgi:hypothetical protein
LGRLEGFLSKGNVCNQITNINLGNLVEGHPIHLHGEKIDELCGVGRVGSESELIYYNLQQPLHQAARSFCTNKTWRK